MFTWNKAPWEMKAESELGGPLQPGGNIRACTHIFSENAKGIREAQRKGLGGGEQGGDHHFLQENPSPGSLSGGGGI